MNPEPEREVLQNKFHMAKYACKLIPMLLSIDELRRLRDLLISEFKRMEDLQKQESLARIIKAVQIPSSFSESLVVHLLRQGRILPELQSGNFTLGNSNFDTDIVCKMAEKTLRIEAKATGDKGFQRLGPKDLKADYLVWVHFDAFFKGESGKPILVWTVAQPGRFFKTPRILQVIEFKKGVGPELKETSITFDNLE